VVKAIAFGVITITFVVGCLFALLISLLDYPEKRVSVDIPGYRIDVVEKLDTLEYVVLRVEVTRADGQKATKIITSNDEQICSDLTTKKVGSRIYFLCGNEPISRITTYVDIDLMAVYVGGTWGSKTEIPLADLRFYEPTPWAEDMLYSATQSL